ncbi:SMU1112c/YaeR family gloxylase I-like metalloprotein [Sediminibacterium ginsengisoli]|uniref:Glyoxylase I family protein n=1 Tax=Sediminibacterium ginsengisoli TaxID=413434 RepID=A0A1T4NVX8_9BACT|nr:VOC family protein [Sediminibacterium ginsengisoli]SJZ83383.1 glyoxylase I family protein [Sediminibacterium ginsengisoli]
MIGIESIHHVALLTDNAHYEESKRFYTEVLGFNIISETYREARQSYKLDLALNGRYQLELFSFPDYRERASFPEAKGLRHLAFSVTDVEKSAAQLSAYGVKHEGIRLDELTGKQFVFFYDPSGQPLELYQL